jgi:hypothetical protein
LHFKFHLRFNLFFANFFAVFIRQFLDREKGQNVAEIEEKGLFLSDWENNVINQAFDQTWQKYFMAFSKKSK